MTAFGLSAGPTVAFLTVGNAAALPSMSAQQHSSTATCVIAICAAGAHSPRRHDRGCERA